MIKDYFRLAFENIRQRRLRSWLTIIGIVIGIAAVVALVSLGQGVKKVITDEFAQLGVDKIFVVPGSMFSGSSGIAQLHQDDMDVVLRVNGVKEIGGILMRSGTLEFKRELFFTTIVGLPEDNSREDSLRLLEESYNFEYVQGRALKPGDKYKCIIGHDVAVGKLTQRTISVGEKITVDGQEFQVVGVLKQMGDPGIDTAVAIPKSTAREIYHTEEESQLMVRIEQGSDATVVAENIKKALRKHRNQKEGEEDFTVQTTQQLLDSFNVILDSLSAIVIGIAAISLFVGAVGIMNTMYTAVLQRTNEIGVMKAIGARDSHIMQLFLIESGVLGLIGGVIGVIIGIGLSKIVEFIGRTFLDTLLLRAYFPWYLIVGALLFAFIVGTTSGIMPARQASKMKPVDALRYE